MANPEQDNSEGSMSMDMRIDRVFNCIGHMGYNYLYNAIEKNKELPPDEIIDHDTNLIIGAGDLLSLMDEISDDDDFLAIARARILVALHEHLRLGKQK